MSLNLQITDIADISPQQKINMALANGLAAVPFDIVR